MPKFISSLAVFTKSIVPCAVSLLICDCLLIWSSYVHLCLSGHSNNTWNSKGLAFLLRAQGASGTLRVRLAPLSCQVPSLNNATQFLSITQQQDTRISLPQQCYNSPYNDNNFFSLVSSSRLCDRISERLDMRMWHVVLILGLSDLLLNFEIQHLLRNIV